MAIGASLHLDFLTQLDDLSRINSTHCDGVRTLIEKRREGNQQVVVNTNNMNKFELDQLTAAPAVHEQVVFQPEQEKVCCSRVSPHHGQTVLLWLQKKEREGVI